MRNMGEVGNMGNMGNISCLGSGMASFPPLRKASEIGARAEQKRKEQESSNSFTGQVRLG